MEKFKQVVINILKDTVHQKQIWKMIMISLWNFEQIDLCIVLKLRKSMQNEGPLQGDHASCSTW